MGLPVASGENLYARWLSSGVEQGGPAIADLLQSGQTARGIRITIQNDGGDDWTLAGAARAAVSLRSATGRRRAAAITADADYFTLTVPVAVIPSADRSDWRMRITRRNTGDNATASARIDTDNQRILIELGLTWAGSVNDIRDLLASLEGISASNVAISGTGTNPFDWDANVTRDIAINSSNGRTVGRRHGSSGSADSNYFSLALPTAIATPGADEEWTLRIHRKDTDSETTAVAALDSDNRLITITLGESWTGSVNSVRTALATIDGIANADVTISGSGGSTFQWVEGESRDIAFSAGSPAEDIHVDYDEGARKLTVNYLAADVLDDIIEVIQAVPNVNAEFLSGTTDTDTNTAEASTFTDKNFVSEVRYLVSF